MSTARPAPFESSTRAGYLDNNGVVSWVFSLDHKRIAVMQLAGLMAALGVFGALGLAMRVEHLSPAQDVTVGLGFARLFTVHGTGMLFLFALPGIPASLGSFVLPLQLGARNVAFPRLHLAAFYGWLVGAVLLLVSILHGAVHAGWTLYPPYSLGEAGAIGLHAVGVIVLVASAAARALVFLVTIHTQRSPATPWSKLGTLAWSIYAYSWVVAIAAPVLMLTLGLLLLERSLGAGLFDPALGGDPLLYQALFWSSAHGLVISPMLPAIGVVAEVLSVLGTPGAVRRVRTVVALTALAVLSFLAWGVHFSAAGAHSSVLAALFSLLALLAVVPASRLVHSWISAFRAGPLRAPAPVCFALVFVSTFVVAGLSGVFLAVLGTGVHLHNTTFVAAHAHYMLGGALLAAFLAGLHYFWPKITGRSFVERTARRGSALLFLGVHLWLFPELIAGARGLPRRMAAYPIEFSGLEQLAALGALVFMAAMALIGYNLLRSLKWPADAPADPWGAASLERTIASPPPVGNPQSGRMTR